MKAFLVTVSSLCLCGILLCFLAYVTGRLGGAPVVTSSQPVVISQTVMETDPLCSPCVENIAKMIEMMETEWEADMTVFFEQSVKPVETDAPGWEGLSQEQRKQTKQLFDQYGTEEGLRRLSKSDPEAARRFESLPKPGQGRRPSESTHDTSDDAALTR